MKNQAHREIARENYGSSGALVNRSSARSNVIFTRDKILAVRGSTGLGTVERGSSD